jgi:hypothetical protein
LTIFWEIFIINGNNRKKTEVLMFCSNCGKENPDNAKFCAGCGKPIAQAAAQPAAAPPVQQTIINMAPPPQAAPAAPAAAGISPKSRAVTGVLAFFFGWLGIHRF